MKTMYIGKSFSEILSELEIDREIKAACVDLVFDDALLKIKFLKAIKDKGELIKQGTMSFQLNNCINQLNDQSGNLEILKKVLDLKKCSYGQNYYSGLNIVKYLIRLS